MSGAPQFNRLMSVMGTGVANADPGNWQIWIGHSGTPEIMRKVIELGPDVMLTVLKDAPSPLVHWLFMPVDRQAARWREWLPQFREVHDVTVSDEAFNTFITNNPAPAWPDNRLTTVALTLRSPSAAKEFQLYWPLIVAQQEKSWKRDEFFFDGGHVRWLAGSENTNKDWHFEWQVINLGANRNTSSETVRQAYGDKLQPNVGILAAAALHPEWIKSMDGQDIPYVDLPGYEVSVPGLQSWRHVPYLGFHRDSRRVRLYAHRCGSTDPEWSVPSLAGV